MNKKEKIRYCIEQLIEQGNTAVVDEVFTSGYIAHAGNRVYKQHGFLKQFARQIRSAIPDIRVTNVEFLVKAGNYISWQRTLQGTHKADLKGIPASGKRIKWNEMLVSRFENGKIAEEWLVSELAGELLLKQPRKK